MKKIISILVLAMAFTFSCSDDKDSDKVEAFGCRPGAKNICFEIPVSFFTKEGYSISTAMAGTKESCENMNEDDDGNGIGVFYESGCPGGSALECSCPNENSTECQAPFSKFYFYDAIFKNMTCDEAFSR
jgi:hypothetical protein